MLGIGAIARLSIKTDVDFFLSGRSLPAWITGLAFSDAVKHKAAGVNLWTGLGMLVFGALIVFWALARPVVPTAPDDSR